MTRALYLILTSTELSAETRFAAGLELAGIIGGMLFFGLLVCIGLYTLVRWWQNRDTIEEEDTASVAPTATPQDDLAMVAVLTAAVAMMLDKPTTAFRVVSFRRAGTQGRAWNAGQTE